ncbi:hypothetical protein [uncultured Roseovarius sp.]|uniref:hypothetical protein n=1 Tax=uncultured Roseovarius sp. TaxID=293344 RepID=UPI002610EBEF|nr:hypothetical protein [uncultured Roseovarius sp.]
MEYAFAKREARRERYKTRAKTARFYARLVMLLLVCTTAAAAWQDDTYGPQMKQYALIAMEKFEAATDEDSASRKLVQTAISKLEL